MAVSALVASIPTSYSSPLGPLRRFCRRLVRWKWFSRISIFVVLVNTVMLGLTDYSDAWESGPNMNIALNAIIEDVNNVSLGIFIFEALIKIMAQTFWSGRFAYIKDHWNKLDLIVILSGYE